MALTQKTHELIVAHFSRIDLSNLIAVDGTCGNGHDTNFLATLGFAKVIGFDVQQAAIEITQQRINSKKLNNVELIHDGHENIKKHINQKIACVMFNLGYMPNADKMITTNSGSTIKAITAALKLLSTEGLVSILCYPGHPEGKQETIAVQALLNKLNGDWQVNEVLASHPSPRAPILYLVTRSIIISS